MLGIYRSLKHPKRKLASPSVPTRVGTFREVGRKEVKPFD